MEDRDSRFAQVAVGLGLVSTEQIQECSQVSRSSYPPKPLGQVLVEMGVLTLDQFFQVMRQVDSQIASGSNPPTPGFTGGLNPKALLGQRFGRYHLVEELGRGGMGVVFKAKDEELDRTVALKILRDTPNNQQVLKRFQREAQMASKLRHPNIVSVHDVGTFMGAHYFTMDYIEGSSLDQLMTRHAFKLPQAVKILEEVARAVHHAHQQGIVHRDLKPANVMVDRENRPCVLDFGLAKWVDAETKVTRTGQALGTPLYMSPEQVEGNARLITPLTDVYALGVMLYEMLTGRPPFEGKTAIEIYRRIMEGDPKPPRQIRARIPADVETICLKAMARDPARRYRSAAAFAEDLARFRQGEPIQARPASTWERFTRRVYRRRMPIMAGALLVATAAAVVYAISSAPISDPERENAVGTVTAQAAELIDRAFVKSLSDDPDVDAPTKKALALLDELLKKYPDEARAHYLRARAFALRGELDPADRALNASIDILPTAPAHYLKGRLLVQRYFNIALQPTQDEELEKRWGPQINAWRIEAVKNFTRALELGASGEERLLSDAFLAILNKDYETSIAAATKLLDSTERHEEVYLLRAWAQAGLGRHAEAEKDLTEAIRRRPTHVGAYSTRGALRVHLGRHEEAIADFDRALQISPDSPSVLATRGQAKGFLKRTEEGIADARRAIELQPSFHTHNTLGTIAAYGGRFKEAIDAFTEAMRFAENGLGGGLAGALTNRGWAKSMARDIDGAIEDYTRALKLAEDANTYSNLADLKRLRQDFEGALADYDAAIRLRPHFGPTYFFRACAKAKLEDEAGMLEDLELAIQKIGRDVRYDSYYVGACLMRAEYHAGQGDFRAAVDDCTRALERKADYPDALALRGQCHIRRGDLEPGVRDLERLFEVNPGAPRRLREVLDDARRRMKEPE